MSALIRVRGSHEEVGTQIGTACREAIHRATTFTADQLPADRSLADQLALSDEFRAVTAEAFPWLITELDAAADAAGVDRRHLFAASVEEIWPGRDTTAKAPTPAFRGCTDIAAVPPATAESPVLVGHNNDLPGSIQDHVSAVEWRVDGKPTVFSLGVGPWLSAAWNSTGLNITGNELAPNDDRVGIPRLLLMTAVTRAESLAEAKDLVDHEMRASSYNWLLADAGGVVASLEGSATAMVELTPDQRGLLHHENHYTDETMRPYERNARHASRSEIRGRRVAELLGRVEPGRLTRASLRGILSDHEGAPESVCRHADGPDDMQTVFWSIAEPARREVEYGLGPPCSTEPQLYVFE
jgi:isopenicillin-N N-acyltransferase-like protein